MFTVLFSKEEFLIMKKTLVSALTTALVVGAASTTFAASNPFSDVPADHWAYDAVSQLAADGVIEGYGDSTFQGNKNITRYEMAQMVAKAMAKTDVSAADKAMIDKLAAEFADELNNLGVRVANLEKHADNVKWEGKVEYTYTKNTYKANGAKEKVKDDNLLFRLEPTATVNDHWDVHARLDAATKMDDDAASGNGDHVTLARAWAQANYKNFTGKFGKFGSSVNDQLVFDDPFSGAAVTFGNALKVTAEAGRVANGTVSVGLAKVMAPSVKDQTGIDLTNLAFSDRTANYQGIGLGYNFGKLATKAGYQHFDWNVDNTVDDIDIWSVGATYTFDKNLALNAEYAKGNRSAIAVAGYVRTPQDSEDKAYNFQLNYKGAQDANKGSWGAWVGYRYLGSLVALDPTYDVVKGGYKGWEIGGDYTLAKNIKTTLRYGDSKWLANNNLKLKQLFGRVEFFF